MLTHIRTIMLLTSCGLILAQSHWPLDEAEGLQPINVSIRPVELDGKRGIKVLKAPQIDFAQPVETLVLLPEVAFLNGSIELEIAGTPHPDAVATSRGFVGIAFRLQQGPPNRYECFYLRPANGRAQQQIRRNHAVQYVSHPDYPWYRLRKEMPGHYETYVDLAPSEWTSIRIEVDGSKAQLYVHGQTQPTLVVNDLKLEPRSGGVALWLHTTTIAHYRNLIITPKP